jgi:periplasmic protein TonB
LKEIDMLAYASHRRRVAERRPAPHAMMAIIVAHIAVVAAVMSARMDLPRRILRPPIVVTPIPLPTPPPEQPQVQPQPAETVLSRVPTIVPLRLPQPGPQAIVEPVPQPGLGDGVVRPIADPLPIPAPVRVGPRFATPPSELRPPYPVSKIQSQEEAVLKLRLSIDAQGRVVAVDPVGRADPAFLAAARRHLIAHWRYKPATEDGRAIASATVISLRFELE